jgi:hypothetical protein
VCGMWGGGVVVGAQALPSPNGSLYRNTEEVGTNTIHACLISHLLALCLVLFRAFSYDAYLRSAPSPKALTFTTQLLL